MRYGFVGLGHLGRHLAANLARKGFALGVFDLDRSAAETPLEAGATWAPSVADLARASDALITCLPSPAATAAVLDEALPVMRHGSAWIEMSTNDFAEIEALASRAATRGIGTLACPVTGGVHRAAAGEITVFVGGPQQLFDAHAAALRAMGGRVIHLGGIEQAAVTKVVTNMLAFIHLIAAGEALMLCAKGGVDGADVRRGSRTLWGSRLVIHDREAPGGCRGHAAARARFPRAARSGAVLRYPGQAHLIYA